MAYEPSRIYERWQTERAPKCLVSLLIVPEVMRLLVCGLNYSESGLGPAEYGVALPSIVTYSQRHC
jgi:hypothetical protein